MTDSLTNVVRTSLIHLHKVRIYIFPGSYYSTYPSLKIYEAQPLTYIVADDDKVWVQGPPVLGARGVIQLEPVFSSSRTDLEDEWLVNVPKEGDGDTAGELLSALANAPGSRDMSDGASMSLGFARLTRGMWFSQLSHPLITTP